MDVVVGTYNNILFGFHFDLQLNDEGTSESWKFKPLFTDQGHTGCVKTVASGGRYLASGSTDETIRLFDMKKHVEVGTLVEQSGSITALVFCGTTHMLSGSEDGSICIWKTKTWELEKVMKGHKGSIMSLSAHPSGRLALSVSKDKSIRTWNLLTGRTAYTTGIKEVGEIVRWSPTGDTYAIVVGPKVTVYKIKGVSEPIVYKCDKYILAAAFLSESVLLLAGESEDVILYDFERKLVLQRISAHKVRVKDVAVQACPGEEDKLLLFTVASDGNMKAWALNKTDFSEEASLLASLDMPGRPTSVSVNYIPPVKGKKVVENAVEEEVAEEMEVNENGEEEAVVEAEKKTDEVAETEDTEKTSDTENNENTEETDTKVSEETEDTESMKTDSEKSGVNDDISSLTDSTLSSSTRSSSTASSISSAGSARKKKTKKNRLSSSGDSSLKEIKKKKKKTVSVGD